MAAGYMRKVLEERNIRDVEVRSAGVMTATGLLSTAEAIQLLDTVGVDLRRHRSSQLTPELIRKADLILGMTPFHVQFALRMTEDAKDKTALFKEYTGSDPKNYQITDPMGHTLEVYKRVFREIRQACEFLVEKEIITGKAPEKPKSRPPKKPPTRRKKAAQPKTATAKPSTGAKKPASKTAKAHSASGKKATAKAAKSASSSKSASKAATKPPTKTAAKKTTKGKSGKARPAASSSSGSRSKAKK